MTDQARSRLEQGAAILELRLSEATVEQLLRYLGLLRKWNRLHNLTAVRDPDQMLTHHLFDSLAVLLPLKRKLAMRPSAIGSDVRLLDVGSGAGFPGIVIAICHPEWKIDCIDGVAKKAAFMRQVGAELSLPNLQALQGRVEKLQVLKDEQPFDVITARAFSSLDKLVAYSEHLIAKDGYWLAMKGKIPSAEIVALPPSIEMFHVEQLVVPGLDEQRCIVWMRKNSDCDTRTRFAAGFGTGTA